MKWDIDKSMAPFEPTSIPGTIWQRTLMQASLARKEGLLVRADTHENAGLLVWSLAIGLMAEPKYIFVYGYTMRECFLRLRKLVKTKKLKLDPRLFPKLFPRPKPKQRRKKKGKPTP